jgi:hypothetical protein
MNWMVHGQKLNIIAVFSSGGYGGCSSLQEETIIL